MTLRLGPFFLCAVLLSGCKPSSAPTQPPPSLRVGVLDELFMNGDVVIRIKAAEQDLPGDDWRNQPERGKYNVSRSQRASDLAKVLLEPVPRRLQGLSVEELVGSLKVFPSGNYGSFDGVAYYVYLIGNRSIMEELRRRPQSELETLRRFKEDRRMIYTGDSGGVWTIGDLVINDLLTSRTNGQPKD